MANWNPFAGLLSAADPNAENKAYGVPESDVRMAQAGLLGNLGATLLAAGQRISPAQRAQLLGQLGPQMGQFSTDIYNAAQRRYQQGMLEEAKAKRKEEDEERKRIIEEQARLGAMVAPTFARPDSASQWQRQAPGYGAWDVSAQMAKIDPGSGTRLMLELLKGDEPAPKAAPGSSITLIDPKSGDKRETRTGSDVYDELTAKGWIEFQKPAAVPTPAYETEYSKATGKAAAATVLKLPTLYANQQRLKLMESLGQQYEAAGGEPGPLGAAITEISRYFPKSFNPNMNAAAAKEALDALSNTEMMSLIGTGDGEGGFPANNFSNADKKFLEAIPARLQNFSYLAKLEIAREVNSRNIAVSDLTRNYIRQGIPPDEAMARAAEEASKKDLFTEEVQKRLSLSTPTSTRAVVKPGTVIILPEN